MRAAQKIFNRSSPGNRGFSPADYAVFGLNAYYSGRDRPMARFGSTTGTPSRKLHGIAADVAQFHRIDPWGGIVSAVADDPSQTLVNTCHYGLEPGEFFDTGMAALFAEA